MPVGRSLLIAFALHARFVTSLYFVNGRQIPAGSLLHCSGLTCKDPPESAFKAAMQTVAANASRILVLDVGANDGAWMEGTLRMLLKGRPHLKRDSVIDAIMFEPQSNLRGPLTGLVDRWNSGTQIGAHASEMNISVRATHVPAAAWITDTNLTFYESTASRTSKTASLERRRNINGTLAPLAKTLVPRVVPAVDLAAFITRHAAGADAVIFKLDIEGAEYSVLPALLTSGALCHVDLFQIEWHLNNLEAERRLEGIALRLALEPVMRGCAQRRLVKLMHEEYVFINDGVVKGLSELARGHGGAGVQPEAAEESVEHHEHERAGAEKQTAAPPPMPTPPIVPPPPPPLLPPRAPGRAHHNHRGGASGRFQYDLSDP